MNLLNQFINDDCFNVLPNIADESVDLILTDLPYGTTSIKWDSVLPLDQLWKEYIRIIKPQGAIVLTASQPFTNVLINSQPHLFKYEWIWCKNTVTSFLHAKNAPMKKHENVLVFSKGQIKHSGQTNRMEYNPQGLIKCEKKVDGRKDCEGDRKGHRFSRPSNKTYIQEWTNYPTSLLFFDSEVNTEHPTQKPVELMEYLIKTYTTEGAVVLDNTAGVATTAVAAINTNRNYIAIELDPAYHTIGQKRIEEANNKKNKPE